ncbi:MAG TPA: hypothetical protein VK697_04750 [Methylomirabilota bacterium]|nr:hypothetical protein [Methylomirabilota bacterium]
MRANWRSWEQLANAGGAQIAATTDAATVGAGDGLAAGIDEGPPVGVGAWSVMGPHAARRTVAAANRAEAQARATEERRIEIAQNLN